MCVVKSPKASHQSFTRVHARVRVHTERDANLVRRLFASHKKVFQLPVRPSTGKGYRSERTSIVEPVDTTHPNRESKESCKQQDFSRGAVKSTEPISGDLSSQRTLIIRRITPLTELRRRRIGETRRGSRPRSRIVRRLVMYVSRRASNRISAVACELKLLRRTC